MGLAAIHSAHDDIGDAGFCLRPDDGKGGEAGFCLRPDDGEGGGYLCFGPGSGGACFHPVQEDKMPGAGGCCFHPGQEDRGDGAFCFRPEPELHQSLTIVDERGLAFLRASDDVNLCVHPGPDGDLTAIDARELERCR